MNTFTANTNNLIYLYRMIIMICLISPKLIMAMNPVITDYPVEGHWPYGPSMASETWSDGNGTDILFYGEGTVLRIAKAGGSSGLVVYDEVRTNYPVHSIDVLENGSLVAISDDTKWVTLVNPQTSPPLIVGRYEVEDGRKPSGLAFVDENLLVVAVQPAGLWALDISNPASITLAGNYVEPGTDFVFDVEVLGDFAFLADDNEGVSAINISDPTNLFLSNRFAAATRASHISIYENKAYVSRGSQGLTILELDVTQNPVAITDLGTVDDIHMPAGFGSFRRTEKASNGLLVVSDSTQGNGVVLMDATDPAIPTVYGGTSAPNSGLAVLGNYAYSSRPSWYNSHGIYVYDLNATSGGGHIAPVEVDYLPLITESVNIDVGNDIITLATSQSGIVMIDSSNPSSPITGSWINNLGNSTVAAAVKVNNTVAVANYGSSLKLVDVTDIVNPNILPELDFGNGHIVQFVEKAGTDAAVVATGSQGVKWVNLSDPLSPVVLGTWVESSNRSINRLIVNQDMVIAFSNATAWIIDFSNKISPQELDTFSYSRPILDGDVDGNILYLANDIDGLRILDISVPTNATELATFSTNPTYANGVSVKNNIAYIAADTFYGMLLVDVSTPASPQYLSTIETPGNAKKVEATDDLLVLADYDSGLRIWSKSTDFMFENGFE